MLSFVKQAQTIIKKKKIERLTIMVYILRGMKTTEL